jgi:hypothetical protein
LFVCRTYNGYTPNPQNLSKNLDLNAEIFYDHPITMKWKLPNGREANVNPMKYKIDWERKVSGPQFLVKQFLYPYWKNDIVLEEFVMPKSGRKRIDLCNLSRRVIIEVSPDSTHLEFNEFMHGSRAGYLKRIKSDYQKMELAELNGFIFIELNDEHLSDLTVKMFKEKFNYSLV